MGGKISMVCISDDLGTCRPGTIPKPPNFTYAVSISATSTKHSYSAKSWQILSRESKLLPSVSVQRIGTAGWSLHVSHRPIHRPDYSAVFQSPVHSSLLVHTVLQATVSCGLRPSYSGERASVPTG